jgi:hypothetical protein
MLLNLNKQSIEFKPYPKSVQEFDDITYFKRMFIYTDYDELCIHRPQV